MPSWPSITSRSSDEDEDDNQNETPKKTPEKCPLKNFPIKAIKAPISQNPSITPLKSTEITPLANNELISSSGKNNEIKEALGSPKQVPCP